MNEREINEKISAWAGRPCTCVEEYDSDNIVQGIPQKTRYWGNCAMHSVGGHPKPYVTSDRCAVELLSVLVDHGHTFKILGASGNYYMEIGTVGYAPMITVERQTTIAEAICQAVTSLIDQFAKSI